MFGKDKKKNYTVLILSVLLAIAVLYIAFDQFSRFQGSRLQQAYSQGVIDGQENAFLAVVSEVQAKGYVQITDFRTNSSIILVPYQPTAQEQTKQ